MLSTNADLRLQLLLLPFTEPNVRTAHNFEALAGQPNRTAYRRYLEDVFLRSIFPSIHRKQRVNNLDEMRLLLIKFFPYEEMNAVYEQHHNLSAFYLQHLTKIGNLFLTHRNGKIALKYWSSKTNQADEDHLLGPYTGLHKVQLWNSMSRMFPTDIMVIMYLLDNDMREDKFLTSYHGIVSLEDVQLDQVLSKGVAETHMHLNAGGHFLHDWNRLMSPHRLIVSPHYKVKSQYIDALIGEVADLPANLAQAVIMRIMLAAYLKYRHPGDSFYVFYERNFPYDPEAESAETYALLMVILRGDPLTENQSWNYDKLYEKLQDRFHLAVPFSQEQLQLSSDIWESLAQQDKIYPLLQPLSNYSTTENIFLFRALRYMRFENVEDSQFAGIFWRYTRIKHLVYQLLVQGNQIKGLDFFREFYGRLQLSSSVWKDDPTQRSKIDRYKLLLHVQLQNPYLRKLEVRIAPPDPPGKSNDVFLMKRKLAKHIYPLFKAYLQLVEESIDAEEMITPRGALFAGEYEASDRRLVTNVVTQAIGRPIGMLGVVFHFMKAEDMQGIEKCWVDGMLQSGVVATKLYFQELRDKYRTQMEAIRGLREEIEFLSDYIVGIDAAGAEHSLEPWVLAPIYQLARDSRTHKLIHQNAPYRRIRNLGLTYHVGEDFRHLISGLRHIDEVIEHCQFHAGDRIGHAIALGISSEEWYQRNRVVIMPRIEYMENLLWIWGIHKDARLSRFLDISYLEKQVLQEAEKIYHHMTGITVYALWKAYRNKFSLLDGPHPFEINYGETGRPRLFCTYIRSDDMWDEDKLAHAQHCKCYLYGMVEPIHIEITREDIAIIEHLQQVLKEKVSREGIVVETNPTSNRAIGDIEHLFKHYIQRLNQRSVSDDHNVENGIMVTINSDDPVIFNTNINNEFAYMFYALLDKGYAREDILNWIDKVRELGQRSSFIDSTPRDPARLSRELQFIVKKLKKEYID